MVVELQTVPDPENPDSNLIISSLVFVTSKGVESIDVIMDEDRIRAHLKEKKPILITDGQHFVPVLPTRYLSKENIEKMLFLLQKILGKKYVTLPHTEKENFIALLEIFGDFIVSGHMKLKDRSLAGNLSEIKKLIVRAGGMNNICRLCHARVQIHELKRNAAQLLFEENIPLSQILRDGYTLRRLLKDGVPLQFLFEDKESKITLSQLADAGISKEELLNAGIDVRVLVEGYHEKGAALLAYGFNVQEMWQSGMTEKEIFSMGVSIRQFREAGFNEPLEVYGIDNRFSWFSSKNIKYWNERFEENRISLSSPDMLELLSLSIIPFGCEQFVPLILSFIINSAKKDQHNLQKNSTLDSPRLSPM